MRIVVHSAQNGFEWLVDPDDVTAVRRKADDTCVIHKEKSPTHIHVEESFDQVACALAEAINRERAIAFGVKEGNT